MRDDDSKTTHRAVPAAASDELEPSRAGPSVDMLREPGKQTVASSESAWAGTARSPSEMVSGIMITGATTPDTTTPETTIAGAAPSGRPEHGATANGSVASNGSVERGRSGDLPVDAAAEDAEVVVLFDGGCPLCKREIAHYRRLDAGRNRIAWVDLYATPERAAEWGIDPRVALQRMHVIERGQPRVGASAFVAMWRVLPYYRVLGRVFDTVPGLTSFADRVYRAFARRRWRSRCASGTCPIPSAYRAPLQDEPTNGRS